MLASTWGRVQDAIAMPLRSPNLANFLAVTQGVMAGRIDPGAPAAIAMWRVATALARPVPARTPGSPRTQPACDHLAPAIDAALAGPPDVARVAAALRDLAPDLCWRPKASDDPVFTRGHANASITGPMPEALERRDDVWIGISLVAPGITYPDHAHPPEEVYLVLSDGFWRQNAESWHAPGPGGIVYNPRGITHAMRAAGSAPLLAVWCLPID
jgi:hypothetical protein